MFGVCDGHGSNGKEVSNFIRQVLPSYLATEKSFKAAFSETELLLNQQYDTNLSGSTVTLVLFQGNKITSINAGDSRAIKVAIVANKVKVTQLTNDHKPDLIEEKQRIINSGGRIDSYKDYASGQDVGPQRVWLKK